VTKWSFEIPGQPPSVNNMYTQIILRRGVSAVPIRSVKKDEHVAAYQVAASLIARSAKPRGWTPNGGQIRIYYDFELRRMADADNLLKALNDAIAKALNVDDKVFLPCVRSKTTGSKDPKVVVEIDDGCP
jgi:Holliday junction resolvase RusA-like endonuclease